MTVRKQIGALTAVLGGIDSLVFTGGIGERSAELREEICEGLEHLGVDTGRVSVHVVASDENRIVARHTAAVVRQTSRLLSTAATWSRSCDLGHADLHHVSRPPPSLEGPLFVRSLHEHTPFCEPSNKEHNHEPPQLTPLAVQPGRLQVVAAAPGRSGLRARPAHLGVAIGHARRPGRVRERPMILSPTYDVIVVGARVAGAATAMRLAEGGLRVLLVDRSRHGADTLSTHALMRGGVLQLQRWGLLDRIVDAGTPPVRSTTIRIGNDEIVVPIKPSHGVDALYAPRRTVLDPILVDAAFAAGADVRFGVTVTGVLRTRGRITGIVGRDDSGQRIEVEAGLVIGADGVRSTIANRVDAPVERIGTGATAVIYGYWRDLETSGYEWEFRSGASVGLIPTNDGETCVFAGASPNRVGTGGLELMRGLLQDASPSLAARVAAGTAPLGVRTFAGRPGLMRRALGARLGARRRRRLLEGPAEHARSDGRDARRRAALPGDPFRSRPRSSTRRRPLRLPGDPGPPVDPAVRRHRSDRQPAMDDG